MPVHLLWIIEAYERRSGELTFEVDLAVAVGVEDVDDALHERVLLQLGQLHELVDAQRARVVQIQLPEALAQAANLIRVNCRSNNNKTWSSSSCDRCKYTQSPPQLAISTSVTSIQE